MSSAGRALRLLLVANDGFSAGHVARTVAIARALPRRARARDLTAQIVIATTSEAHTLLAEGPFAVVRLPAPVAARRAGFADVERRRLVRGILQGTCDSFAPDLLVVDTFPFGPHGELAGIRAGEAKRALVRRAVRAETDPTLTAGVDEHDVAIVTDDPVAQDVELSVPVVRVPPITLFDRGEAMDRAAARRALGLPIEGEAVLVASGGGGDAEAVKRAVALAEKIARVSDAMVVRAAGPLEPVADAAPSSVHVARVAPLQPLLAAFDQAFAPAGYNMAHELAKAGVPAALFAQPRPFDDQAARAARFAELGLAFALEDFTDDHVARALAWMKTAPRPKLEAGGADRAADALLDLVTQPQTGRAR